MRWLLVPHALTTWNVEGRYQGQTDTPLTDLGRRQAAALRRRLAGEPIVAGYVSDLRRAWDTALALRADEPWKLQEDSRLREIHFGAFEGLTHDEVLRAHGPAYAAWQTNTFEVAPPAGETGAQLAARIRDFADSLKSQYCGRGETVLVVAHRGSLRVLLCVALGLPPREQGRFRLEPASVSELLFGDRGAVLNRWNDVHHLRECADVR